ncbi:AAA family ATPase, partial [bacterium]|nr:AAA family ATPase [bacterium]
PAILELQRCVRDIPVSEHVLAYCIDLVRMTRPGEPGAPDFVKANLTFGAGPRAGQYLVLAAKAWAALEG